MLLAVAALAGGAFLLVGPAATKHALAPRTQGSQAASGALAYVGEDGDIYYQNDTPPYYQDPSMVDDSWLAQTYVTDNPPADAETVSAPSDSWSNTWYWPASSDVVYQDDSDPYYTYDPYSYDSGSEITVTVDEPWYISYFPGMGQVIVPLLPPIAQPQVIQPPPAPRPSCSVSASPRVVARGGTSVVSWATQNAARSTLSSVGDVPGTGSRTYNNIGASQTITLTVSGLGGSSSCSTDIIVQAPQAAPTCMLSVHPETIRRGETASLAWLTENAVSAQLTGFGNVPQTGGRVVSPQQSTAFSMTVQNATGQTGTCATQLTVQ